MSGRPWQGFLLQCLSFLPLSIAEPPTSRLVRHDETFVPDHILRISYERIQVACETRDSYVVNGTLPGPTVRIQTGRVSWIRVYNDVKDANVTMHLHGLSQRMSPFADGTPGASQFVIPPFNYFDYEIAPGHLDAGTYFMHSHVDLQAQSAFAPVIVEDNGKPPYEYDEERIVALSDYFNKTDEEMLQDLTGIPFKWSGDTNAILLNGQGVSNTVTEGSATCGRPAFDIEAGKTYRFRFIGGQALSYASLAIEGHEMTIIAADARYTKPQKIQHLQIGSGQRFDVLIKAKTEEELQKSSSKAFYMRFDSKGRPANYTGYAAFRYDKKPIPFDPPQSIKDLQLPDNIQDWLEYTLEPLIPNDFPSAAEVTRRLTITVQQDGTKNGSIRWFQNGLNWNESTPPTPVLPAIYLHGQSVMPDYDRAMQNNGWDPKTNAWPAKIGEVLEILLVNTGSKVDNNGGVDNHPHHPHSGHHYDAGFGCGEYDAAANEAKLKNYNPVLRDTTVLYRCSAKGEAGKPHSWRLWRIRVSNPGVWMIHCHVLPHMPMGMQMLWTFGNASEIQKIPLGAAKGYFDYGGSVTGNATQPPVLWHYFQGKDEMPWM